MGTACSVVPTDEAQSGRRDPQGTTNGSAREASGKAAVVGIENGVGGPAKPLARLEPTLVPHASAKAKSGSGGGTDHFEFADLEDAEVQEFANRATKRPRRPKTMQPFSDLLSRSLLLRYHPDRVDMLCRLRGGCTTPEGTPIPTVRERFIARKQEEVLNKFDGLGHLYFVAPERPLPLPIMCIPVAQMEAVDSGSRRRTPRLPERRVFVAVRALIKKELDTVLHAITAVDLDSAMVACQRILHQCKSVGLQRLLAITLQMFLCMNDILVIESIGATFEDAVRIYLSAEHVADAPKDVPDLTTVLELYTLLVGGYRNVGDDSSQKSHVSIQTISVHSTQAPPPHPQGQEAVPLAVETASSSSREARESSASKFHPTLFTPYNYSDDEHGVNLRHSITGRSSALAGHGGSHSSATASLRLAATSAGTSVTGGMISTGSFLDRHDFQLPSILPDEGEREVHMQLVEQVNAMLELQQMLWDTLEYLLKVASYNADQNWQVEDESTLTWTESRDLASAMS